MDVDEMILVIARIGANGRKLKWQGVPRSIHDSHKTVRDGLDGLIITRNVALLL
uniref:Putative E3 ubiquitin-protein ligase SIN-like protein n=1 Tax=Helianthus annuus TaxID=4232 RepID=A0A251TC56_HELAN